MEQRTLPQILDLLDGRAKRLARDEENQPNNQQYKGADKVIHTSDLSALGIKDVSKDRG